MIKINQDSDEIFEKLYHHGIGSDFSSFNETILNQMIDYFIQKEEYEFCKILKDTIDERNRKKSD